MMLMMAQTFVTLPASGAAVAVPVSEALKTFFAGGAFIAEQVVLETSPDGSIYTVAASIPLAEFEPRDVEFSAAYARVRFAGLLRGTPACFLGLNTIDGSLTTVAVSAPADPGIGSAVALSTLPRKKTFYVVAAGQSQTCEAVVEVSLDGTNYNPLFKIQGRLFRQGDIVTVDGFFAFARIRLISGVGTGLSVAAAADPSCC